MLYALVIFASLVAGQADEPPPFDESLPVVEQRVEAISIAHLNDGAELVFFWALVQGQWTCLDHRWLSANMVLRRDGAGWRLEWPDDGVDCYRVVHTACWVESWEIDSPLAEERRRPWFRRLLNPGLARPPAPN